MEQTGPQVHVAPTRCPFCHEGIPRGEQPAVCPGCHALHHVACLDEAGACAACGRKTASPEDSKLEAALRARASARVAAAPREPADRQAAGAAPEEEGWRRPAAILGATGILALVVGVLAGLLGVREAVTGAVGLVLVIALLAPRRDSSPPA